MSKLPGPKGVVKAVGKQLETDAAAIVPTMRIELMQNKQAVVEGCKGVLEYSEDCIRLSSDKLIVRFAGSRLALKSFSSSSAIVEGDISSVEFM